MYFASHQYDNNFFECNQFILICLKRCFTGTRDSILEKPQYFSLNVDESCSEGVYQKTENVSKLFTHSDLCHGGVTLMNCVSLKPFQDLSF